MHLSVAVPAGCGNKCKFCIANMQRDVYEPPSCGMNSRIETEYKRRMAYAKEAGCTSLTLTGEGEPLFNVGFILAITAINSALPSPFHHIQLQTSGQGLNKGKLMYLASSGITGISLSLCCFDSHLNARYTCPQHAAYRIDVEEICAAIVNASLSLRLCLNLTDLLEGMHPNDLLQGAKRLGASQVTFRELFSSGEACPENLWIDKHRLSAHKVIRLKQYVREHGRSLPKLGAGIKHYSIMGMSVVIDSDCMSTSRPDVPRTLVLREDHKLYTRWDDKGSLIF